MGESSSAKALERVTSYGDLAWKVAVLIGIAASLYLNANYVKSERYDLDRSASEVSRKLDGEKLWGRMDSVERALIVLVEEQKARVIQDRILADHEARIRSIESRVK